MRSSGQGSFRTTSTHWNTRTLARLLSASILTCSAMRGVPSLIEISSDVHTGGEHGAGKSNSGLYTGVKECRSAQALPEKPRENQIAQSVIPTFSAKLNRLYEPALQRIQQLESSLLALIKALGTVDPLTVLCSIADQYQSSYMAGRHNLAELGKLTASSDSPT